MLVTEWPVPPTGIPIFLQASFKPAIFRSVVSGLCKACRENHCQLVGGETAELPGLYPPGEYDLVGTIVGTVPRRRLITGDGRDSILGGNGDDYIEGRGKMDTKTNRRINQRVSDVVPVADIRYLQLAQLPFQFQESHVIRHSLARMAEVRQPVDNGNGGKLRHLFHIFMAERTDHDALNHALQVFCHVEH